MKKNLLLLVFILVNAVCFSQTLIIGKASQYGFTKDDSLLLKADSSLIIRFTDVDKTKLLTLLRRDSIKYDDGFIKSLYRVAFEATGLPSEGLATENKISADISDAKYELKLKAQLKDKNPPFKFVELIAINDKNESTAIKITPKPTSEEVRKKDPDNSGCQVKYIFIPNDSLEAKWLLESVKTESTCPSINKHTRWAITYDYTKQDPVHICKRKKPLWKEAVVIESKRMAPTVARDLLLSVINYHPYKDSFTVAIDYNDTFLENAALFTSTFATLTSPSTSSESTGTGKKPTSEAAGPDEQTEAKKYRENFEQLKCELEYYYTSKYNQANLDVKAIENGVNYIMRRMKEVLDIKDFSEAGIIKRGEDLADIIKKDPSITLNDYFALIREVAGWFGKIANYKRFDSKSILVQNKDIMNITLNRYRDRKLMTIPNEAARPYHIEGGFKIDFSLGIFGSSLIDKLYTTMSKEAYDTSFFSASNGVVNRDSIVGIDTVQRKQIIRDKQGSFDIGPAVFLHGYWRTGWDINISGTFGLSINQSADIRYLYGLSLLFGKNSRWVVTIGGISGKTKDISSSYYEGQIIDPITENNGAVPTKDVTKSGWFAGISWNFGGFTIGDNH